MRPLGFQTKAADQIAERFGDYAADPLTITRAKNVPFLQMLVAITGSGKTLMLAETVSRMQAHLPRQPIVLWLSKGRVVVGQTYANLAHGRYADNIPGFTVKALLELAPSDIEAVGTPLMLVATVGKFAQRDQEGSNLRIYDAQLDLAQDSLWDLLKRRRSPDGVKRPLIVIYDEGQNLSDLQTERLLELGPDALISASATPVVPNALLWIMDRLRKDKGWKEEDFRTKVSSAEVVIQGLVKKRISIGGYVTPMETAVDALLEDMKEAAAKAAEVSQPFRPKAIYVASTNTVDGVPISEDVKRPFEQRQARPVAIWRHLVAAGIDPSKIAVYSQLKFDKDVPPPRTFRLFGGADRDYAQFMAGDFEHIIFNLALEEGWDDPMCGFAYIDKEMASARQITQVIGRVLRQPGAAHFAEPILNTAHFYIRADEKGVFEDIIDQVRLELATEHPSVEFTVREQNRRASTFSEPPTRTKTVPTIAILSKPAREPIRKDVSKLMDFRGGGDNTVGRGARMQILQEIGSGDAINYEWIEIEHSNPLSARTVFRRELQRLYPGSLRRGGPLNLVDIELPKFDALVEITSPAADHIRSIAADVVADYVGHSRLIQNEVDHPYFVGPVSVDPATAVPFNNAVHSRYSGLNDLELAIAKAVDRTQRVWCRNQEGSGYFVPLLDRGSTGAFFPDFLVWLDKNVVAIETKGKHLISEDAPRKLFDISSTGDKAKLFVRMITKGRGAVSSGGMVSITGEVGATSWRWENGRLSATYHDEAKEAVDSALQIE